VVDVKCLSTHVDKCGEIDESRRVRWEERLLQEFEDLELQAEGLHLAERDAAVAELGVSQYSEVDLASRLHASVGREVRLSLAGAGTLTGPISRVGSDWMLVRHERTEAVVRMAAVVRVEGASERAVPQEARSVIAKLGLGSALRQLAAARDHLAVTLVDGTVIRGQIRRVGADFVEVVGEAGRVELAPFDALALLRRS
jgi:hypothetical protein